ncbi:MAG: hypothetical protein M1836_007761 [Candelina mexicana]|nr:MAG: hypothetical protein M1836_007761 [Candelina mexicana]
MDQYSSQNCDGKNGSGKANRLSKAKGIWIEDCINIDGLAHSLFLANGKGYGSTRKMMAYIKPGCEPSHFITMISDRWPQGPCLAVDHALEGMPGTEGTTGRIGSIFWLDPD